MSDHPSWLSAEAVERIARVIQDQFRLSYVDGEGDAAEIRSVALAVWRESPGEQQQATLDAQALEGEREDRRATGAEECLAKEVAAHQETCTHLAEARSEADEADLRRCAAEDQLAEALEVRDTQRYLIEVAEAESAALREEVATARTQLAGLLSSAKVEPLGDLNGEITQIDNWIVGLRARVEALEKAGTYLLDVYDENEIPTGNGIKAARASLASQEEPPQDSECTDHLWGDQWACLKCGLRRGPQAQGSEEEGA